MQDMFTTVLMIGAATFTAGAIGFLAVGLYANVFEKFIVEVKEESTGGVSGVGSVAIRKLGTFNRRFMWPGYEDKMRRNLIKSGEPKSYKPEDIMAMQEIGFFGFMAMVVFLAVLIVGFVYEWMKGALEWE